MAAPTRSALVERTRAFVDIPSPSKSEDALLHAVLVALPSFFAVHYNADSVAVVGPPRRADTPLLLIVGHIDTVPIADNVPSRVEGDTVYGCGTSDMKGALAVMVEVARSLPEGIPNFGFDVAFVFFGREELPPNESALLPALEACAVLREADFCVLMEPTDNHLELGCQGNLNLEVRFGGTRAHTARPWLGDNAIANALHQLQPVLHATPHDVVLNGLNFREVATITGLRAGHARNVVPDVAVADINVRYAPNRSADEVEAKWLARFPDAEVTVIGNAAPAPVVADHPLVNRLLAHGAGAPQPKQAWTNAADFAAYGVPAINFGPGNPALAHRRDEAITGAALEASARTLYDLFTSGHP